MLKRRNKGGKAYFQRFSLVLLHSSYALEPRANAAAAPILEHEISPEHCLHHKAMDKHQEVYAKYCYSCKIITGLV